MSEGGGSSRRRGENARQSSRHGEETWSEVSVAAASELVEPVRLDSADVCIGSEPAVWPIAVRTAALPLPPHDTLVRGRYFSLSLDAGPAWLTMSTSLLCERRPPDRCQEKERA
jgi:hypothetical protein